jgi:organic hydroperoxide reductase OsmC/OhrA
MHPFPHHYEVIVSMAPQGRAILKSGTLGQIESSPPPEFGGPGDRWSPEGLFTAAIADCIALNFQAIAANSKFAWENLTVSTKATLNRTEGKMRFTRFETSVLLKIGPDFDRDRARLLLEKAEASCPLSNTLNCEKHLDIELEVA